MSIPAHLQGDGPCQDCGNDNIVWFADNVFWNQVMGGAQARDDPGGIVCVTCFVIRAYRAGYDPRAWRLSPEWPWRRTNDTVA